MWYCCIKWHPSPFLFIYFLLLLYCTVYSMIKENKYFIKTNTNISYIDMLFHINGFYCWQNVSYFYFASFYISLKCQDLIYLYLIKAWIAYEFEFKDTQVFLFQTLTSLNKTASLNDWFSFINRQAVCQEDKKLIPHRQREFKINLPLHWPLVFKAFLGFENINRRSPLHCSVEFKCERDTH